MKEWKFESITYLRTDGRTGGLAWVGARDAYASKKVEGDKKFENEK